MARSRQKPDFTAGVVLSKGQRQLRALELRVKADNLFALQPRPGKMLKTSYHESGQFHAKFGTGAPILPVVDLPSRFLKESAFPLGLRSRQLFTISLENAEGLLQYTGQCYDRRIEIRMPNIDGSLVLQLYVGSTSGQRWVDKTEGYCAATITERSFDGAGYDFLVRLVILSAIPVFHRAVDAEILAAWLEASRDLGIRVIAPFSIPVGIGEFLEFEAHLPDFGGPKGLVFGSTDRDDGHDTRGRLGYAWSDGSSMYKKYDRQLFVDTLNDWGWFGERGRDPSWHTGKPRT